MEPVSEAYTVSVVRLRCAPDEFKAALIAAGMSPIRADQVLASIPCTIKTNVSEAVASQYAEAFRAAGAEVLVERARPAAAGPAPGTGPQAVPTVTMRPTAAAPAPAPAPASEMPGIDLPAAKLAPIALDDLPPDEPFEVVSREHGFADGGAGATPLRPRFPLNAPVTAPGIPLDPPAQPAELELGSEAREPAIDVAEVAPAPSAHAKTAGHQDKQVSFKVVLPPLPEPWWKRRLPHMITAAILLLIGSYVYGCTKVHGRAIGLRQGLADGVRARLRAPGTEFGVWTPATVREAARQAVAEHGFRLTGFQVKAEKICTLKMPVGCGTVYNPQPALSRLSPVEQLQIARGCPKPDWVLSLVIEASSRWGLYSYDVEEVAYTTISRWSPTEEVVGDGRCEESGEDLLPPDPLDGMGEPQMPQLE